MLFSQSSKPPSPAPPLPFLHICTLMLSFVKLLLPMFCMVAILYNGKITHITVIMASSMKTFAYFIEICFIQHSSTVASKSKLQQTIANSGRLSKLEISAMVVPGDPKFAIVCWSLLQFARVCRSLLRQTVANNSKLQQTPPPLFLHLYTAMLSSWML